MVSAKEHGNKKVGRRKRTERDGGGVTGRQMHECSRKEGGMRKRGGWIGLRPLGCAALENQKNIDPALSRDRD